MTNFSLNVRNVAKTVAILVVAVMFASCKKDEVKNVRLTN